MHMQSHQADLWQASKLCRLRAVELASSWACRMQQSKSTPVRIVGQMPGGSGQLEHDMCFATTIHGRHWVGLPPGKLVGPAWVAANLNDPTWCPRPQYDAMHARPDTQPKQGIVQRQVPHALMTVRWEWMLDLQVCLA